MPPNAARVSKIGVSVLTCTNLAGDLMTVSYQLGEYRAAEIAGSSGEKDFHAATFRDRLLTGRR